MGAEESGGKMELLKLSKFKLHLQALITEVRDLREKERSSSVQIHHLVQKQKQTEEELRGRLTGLEAEIASSNELRDKFERQVRYLQDDNSLLESKQNELKETINSLLQTKESFVRAYEDSTCAMRRTIEYRDRKISVLLENINAHKLLFDSIEKEASSVKHVIDDAQRALNEKEEVVAGLRMKFDEVSTFEKLFVEKISNLESNLRCNSDELRRKDRIIAELETQLEAEKLNDQRHLQIEELQECMHAKEGIIQNLISENKALHSEVASLEIIIKRIQETVAHMNDENRIAFSPVLLGQEEYAQAKEMDHTRTNDEVLNSRAGSHCETSQRRAAEITATPQCQENNFLSSPRRQYNNFGSCVSESACSGPQSGYLEPQSAVQTPFISAPETKHNITVLEQQDSECSTTQTETS